MWWHFLLVWYFYLKCGSWFVLSLSKVEYPQCFISRWLASLLWYNCVVSFSTLRVLVGLYVFNEELQRRGRFQLPLCQCHKICAKFALSHLFYRSWWCFLCLGQWWRVTPAVLVCWYLLCRPLLGVWLQVIIRIRKSAHQSQLSPPADFC